MKERREKSSYSNLKRNPRFSFGLCYAFIRAKSVEKNAYFLRNLTADNDTIKSFQI